MFYVGVLGHTVNQEAGDVFVRFLLERGDDPDLGLSRLERGFEAVAEMPNGFSALHPEP